MAATITAAVLINIKTPWSVVFYTAGFTLVASHDGFRGAEDFLGAGLAFLSVGALLQTIVEPRLGRNPSGPTQLTLSL